MESIPGLGFNSRYLSNAIKIMDNSLQVSGFGADLSSDTILRLHSTSSNVPHLPITKGVKRKCGAKEGETALYADPSLCLGLGGSSSSSDSKGSLATVCTAVSSAKETEVESSLDLDLDISLHFTSDRSLSPKKTVVSNKKGVVPQLKKQLDLELSLSTGPSESDITSIHEDSSAAENEKETPFSVRATDFAGIESGSSHWRTETSSVPPLVTRGTTGGFLLKTIRRRADPPAIPTNISASIASVTKSSVTCTSGRGNSSKICKFIGCEKGARGASGFCIAHGGGRRCQRPSCTKGAEGRTAFCKAHGGGRRCEFLGCTKSAEGRTDFCIAHGGGRRCGEEGCTRAARGKSGLCIRHGGGKRCQMENCAKSAEGLSGLCISHGGGRRCQYSECTKGAQGSTMFCKAHGGGKRCTVEGCTKGAEGSTPFCKGHGGGKRCSFHGCPKCVHGGTAFCVAHGGGKRCAVEGCTKSARGRTDFCVRHGGGKRCQFEGCDKSAQGSTDFCKAHGGGKRCAWGQPGSQFGNQADGPCGSFARGKTGLCAMHGALVQDQRVHGGATLGVLVQPDPKSTNLGKTMDADTTKMGCSSLNAVGYMTHDMGQAQLSFAQKAPHPAPPSEGRVHGGSLMALLSGGSSLKSSWL